MSRRSETEGSRDETADETWGSDRTLHRASREENGTGSERCRIGATTGRAGAAVSHVGCPPLPTNAAPGCASCAPRLAQTCAQRRGYTGAGVRGRTVSRFGGMPGRLPFAAAILMYHRFTEAPHESAVARSHFAEHLDFLTRHYEVVSLAEALTLRPGPRPQVALTIDDGYRSFYEVAYPELVARGLTATVFVPVDFIDSGGWMWQDRSIHVLRQADPGVYRVPWRGETLDLDLRRRPALVRSLIQVYNVGRHLDPSSLGSRDPPPLAGAWQYRHRQCAHGAGVAHRDAVPRRPRGALRATRRTRRGRRGQRTLVTDSRSCG